MHDVQRIGVFGHVQPGYRTPSAAHRVERAAAAFAAPGNAGDMLVDDVDGVVDASAGGIQQPQPSERKGGGLAQDLAGDVDDLQTTAA